MIALTEKQFELQGELVDEAYAFFKEQFAEQKAVNQPVIDQQLETLISQSEFAKAQQDRYLAEGVPAQQAAAQALRDLSNTPEGEAYIKQLTQAAAEVGGTEGEQAFRTALSSYGLAPQEVEYLSELSSYGDPDVLGQRLEEGVNYQDPEAVTEGIEALRNFDSTARVREAEGVAAADVKVSGEAARTAAMQQLEKYGIDPSQLASGALDRGMRAQTDAQASLAASQARRDIQSQGVGMDVQAGELAQQSATRELGIQLDSATQMMQSRVRELQMSGMGAEEARIQADREIGYSQQLSAFETAQRGEALTYTGGASAEANTQQAKELAAGVDAYNVYAGNPTQSATAFGTAGSAGGQASGIANQATQTGMGGYGAISGMYGDQMKTLTSGYGVANDIYGNNIQNAQNSVNTTGTDLLGSAMGMAGGMMAMSDERMKTDIKRVGKTDGGIPIYTFRYKSGGPTQIGTMAQDVEKKHPEAVHTAGNGMKGINYDQIPAKGFAQGGTVPSQMSPSNGAIPDDVNINVSAGEFIFPEDVRNWYGEEKLGKMVEKARTDRAGGPGTQSQQPPQPQPMAGAIPT
jgi:hypothetical protein